MIKITSMEMNEVCTVVPMFSSRVVFNSAEKERHLVFKLLDIQCMAAITGIYLIFKLLKIWFMASAARLMQ
jgi:hypothetical protein